MVMAALLARMVGRVRWTGGEYNPVDVVDVITVRWRHGYKNTARGGERRARLMQRRASAGNMKDDDQDVA